MTLQELNDHRDLVLELLEMKEIHAYLLRKALPGAQRLDGMPHNSGPSDPTGDLGQELADLQMAIDAKEAEVRASAIAVEAFIATIPTYKTRRIFTKRFLCGLLWKQVADQIGPNQSAGNVSRICYDYLGEADAPGTE